ncbi:HEAT repeat domain-containing protein [Haliangium sp.]
MLTIALLCLTACPAPGRDGEPPRGRVEPSRSAIAASADASAPSPPMNTTTDSTPSDPEVEAHMRGLAAEHEHERAQAAQWLEAHPERSRPALRAVVERARADNMTHGAIAILGRLGRVEDVALLRTRAAAGGSALAWDAAQALAAHKTPEALAALVSLLDADDLEVVSAAVVALGSRGQEDGRAHVERMLTHAEAKIRYKAVFALDRLGVDPSRAALEAHRRDERDPDVRTLIDRVLAKPSRP